MAQLDFYHMARQGLDLPDCIARLAGRIGHVQFADCPGRGAPGTGEVDFPAALQALKAGGYQGWLGAEYKRASRAARPASAGSPNGAPAEPSRGISEADVRRQEQAQTLESWSSPGWSAAGI